MIWMMITLSMTMIMALMIVIMKITIWKLVAVEVIVVEIMILKSVIIWMIKTTRNLLSYIYFFNTIDFIRKKVHFRKFATHS